MPRDVRVSARESLRTAPPRDKVPVRFEEPDFPLAAVPLPLRFDHDPTGDFPLRDVPEEWALPLAERADAGRGSEFRRGDRALLLACAGLRLRACCAGRLKCGRAGVDLPFEAGALWPFDAPFVAPIGVAASALMAGISAGTKGAGAGARGTCDTGSGAAGSK